MFGFFKRFFGSKNDRILKHYKNLLTGSIHGHAKTYQDCSLEELSQKWIEYRAHWLDHTPSERQCQTFAFVQKFSELILGQRHYDSQILGGLALCDGHVTEMGTGEGKTLTATIPAIYKALEGLKVFVVTVNDYLAHRDAVWMRPLYEAMGLSVGIVVSDSSWLEKKEAYACSIVYVTNHRLGFDYLEDRTAMQKEDFLLPSLDFALIDEVDSILIDEARLPLITSTVKPQDLSLYPRIHKCVQHLTLATDPLELESGDFSIDHRTSQVHLSDCGHSHVEQLLQNEKLIAADTSLYDPQYAELLHLVMASLKATHLYHSDRQYLVIDQKVVLVNEHTGRLSPGQRLSEGLHQAIEAKEQVPIQQETITIASITYQNFFKLFKTICGMTGTADTEAHEFHEIYGLEVIVIPPNKPVIRTDLADLIFVSQAAQEKSLIQAIKDHHEKGGPILVGTRSIDRSEHLSRLLQQENIKHVVLNAKNHQHEANIVAQAGTFGAVTIATNMAGRGTDVILGGGLPAFKAAHPDLTEAEQIAQWKEQQERIRSIGGLHVLGCERNDSRRVDLQLRGRSGRQGDPGSSQFYVSFEDSLLKVLPQKLIEIVKYCHPDPDLPISDPMMDRRIAEFQKAKEGLHFDARKHSLEDDNVINDQRKIIYACRDQILLTDDLHAIIAQYCSEVAEQFVQEITQHADPIAQKNTIKQFLKTEYDLAEAELLDHALSKDAQSHQLGQCFFQNYIKRIQHLDLDKVTIFERDLLLRQLDWLWREHLMQLDVLKQQVSLRSYAQKDPKQEYKIEAFGLFERLMAYYARQIVNVMLKAKFLTKEQHEEREQQDQVRQRAQEEMQAVIERKKVYSVKIKSDRQSRNEGCLCGSGKKHKHCCGALNAHHSV